MNPTETAAAQEKAHAMQERFADWCWEDPDARRRLAGEYNRRFNALVLRDYTAEGERLTLPGLARTFAPPRASARRGRADARRARRRAVSPGRRRQDRRDGDRRDGASPPRPGLKAGRGRPQPHARAVLPASGCSSTPKPGCSPPRATISPARSAARSSLAQPRTTGTRSIMTRSAFERLPVSAGDRASPTPPRARDQLRAMLEHSEGGGGLTVKRLEKQSLREEERLQALLDSPRDPGVTLSRPGSTT